ncbi:MAG TPA: SpoIID/LytB domain-containing protein [Candidatus Bathyarchaeia archaeon]|nr:SpoIID/LytB domain-containing protein [Candidatus Bathyarchaeia archaeon]
MKPLKILLFLGLVISVFSILFTSNFNNDSVFAATCDDASCETIEECQRKKEECGEIWGLYDVANEKNKEKLAGLKARLEDLKRMMQVAETEIDRLASDIVERETVLQHQEEVFNLRVRSYYKRSSQYSPLFLLLSSTTASQLTRELSYRQAATNEDKEAIIKISQNLVQLHSDRDKLENNKAWLAKTRIEVDKATQFLGEEVEKTENYLGAIKGKIAQLTAKQQSLLAARSGTFTTSVGEVPISNIPCSGPPGSPAYCDPGGGDWFAAFSFGAWTHRKGMSQYGAKGRAEAGQSTDDILRHYYNQTAVGKDTGGTILIDGYGALDFENYYLFGIAEMPSSWHPEALKAQAIAARSYAYRYKAEGRSICTSQSCQVFNKGKADNPPAQWRQAVEATRGQVIEGVTTFYSSTAGGYLTTSSWDTVDGQGGPGFASRSWESKAGSPWFYSGWFTQNYPADSAKCNRSHPWLTSEEMADILNAWQVLRDVGNDERILPVTINQCPIGGVDGNPYTLEELKNKAGSLGGAFTAVSSVTINYGNNGETNSLVVNTNKGSVTISGSEYKQAFNLRAPGYIAIRSPLFNIEKK